MLVMDSCKVTVASEILWLDPGEEDGPRVWEVVSQSQVLHITPVAEFILRH
jgi:hypothetical protein